MEQGINPFEYGVTPFNCGALTPYDVELIVNADRED